MAANFVNSVDFSTSIVVNFEAVRPLTSLTPYYYSLSSETESEATTTLCLLWIAEE